MLYPSVFSQRAKLRRARRLPQRACAMLDSLATNSTWFTPFVFRFPLASSVGFHQRAAIRERIIMDTVTLPWTNLEELRTKASIRIGPTSVDPRNGTARGCCPGVA